MNKLVVFISLAMLLYGLEAPLVVEADSIQQFYTRELFSGTDGLESLVDQNEGLPDKCRTDMCGAHETLSRHKGLFHWPRIPVDSRIFLACPYEPVPRAVKEGEEKEKVRQTKGKEDDGLFAYRECLVVGDPLRPNSTEPVYWTQPNMSACPDPPFSQTLAVVIRRSIQGQGPRIEWYTTWIRELRRALQETTEPIVFEKDVINWELFLGGMVRGYRFSKQTVTSDVLHDVIAVTADVVDPSKSDFFVVDFAVKERLLDHLVELVHLYDGRLLKAGETKTFASSTIIAQVDKITASDSDSESSVILQKAFSPEALPKVSVTLPSPAHKGGDDEFLVTTFVLHDGGTLFGARVNTSVSHSPSPVGPVVYVMVEPVDERERMVTASVEMALLSTTQDTTASREIMQCAYLPAVLVGQENYTTVDFKLDLWYSGTCERAFSAEDDITCRCRTNGWFTVFAERHRDSYIGAKEKVTTFLERGSLDVFVGFPYSWELYLVGHILRALSLLCLLATLLSFALFRGRLGTARIAVVVGSVYANTMSTYTGPTTTAILAVQTPYESSIGRTHRGTPTAILVQLSIALTGLLVVLYVAELVATSKDGCMAANILRYYLVMVTLLWNAVEAFNMYLMLVRVFNSEIHRFVLKATVTAWGIPALMLGIAAAAGERFGGYYEDCKFRCGLSGEMLYWGYLLPMCFIIFCNVTVFVLVFRVLTKHKEALNPASNGSRVGLMRFVGAVAMLVLLGIPWIFSAFGAISAIDSEELAMLEGVFQIVFVVFVNLQGIFIFMFHCVRNADVRKHWRVFVSSGFSTTKTSMELKRSANNGQS